MTDINAAFETILTELDQIQRPSANPRRKPFFPGLIPAGPNGSISVNQEIEKEIRAISKWLLDQRSAAKKQYSLKEWHARVRNAFGPALVQLDTSLPATVNAKALRHLVETATDAPAVIATKFTSMGCVLFDAPIVSPIAIGPVRFETKSDWLARARQDGHITSESRNRLEQALSGSPPSKHTDPRVEMLESSILDVLTNSQLVCTVETNNLASEMADNRAIIGARLAQTAIALLWRRPSYALDGFRLSVDHGPRLIRTIPYIPGEQCIGGSRWRGSPFGPNMAPADWVKQQRDARDFLDLAGTMIACWTSTEAYDSASPVLRNLSQALNFFWEGCRQENDLIAIVGFTAALEWMAQGMSGPIRQLAKARLGIKDSDKIVGEKNIKQVVDWIYSTGRSRTLHGNNPEILHDWSDARAVAESLTRHCLVMSMEWLLKNPTATDAKSLRT